MGLIRALTQRHGGAWFGDRWYRYAWFVWPQASGMFLFALYLVLSHTPTNPKDGADWAYPIDKKSLSESLYTLRREAAKEPAAAAMLMNRAKGGDAMSQFFAATLFDPTIDRLNANPDRTNEAIELYREAALQNIAPAQANLGALLVSKISGAASNCIEGLRWLEMAAPETLTLKLSWGASTWRVNVCRRTRSGVWN